MNKNIVLRVEEFTVTVACILHISSESVFFNIVFRYLYVLVRDSSMNSYVLFAVLLQWNSIVSSSKIIISLSLSLSLSLSFALSCSLLLSLALSCSLSCSLFSLDFSSSWDYATHCRIDRIKGLYIYIFWRLYILEIYHCFSQSPKATRHDVMG